MTANAPRTYGRYRLEELVGVGSISEAWRAKSFGVEGFEKTLVVKRLLPSLAADREFVDAFVREAKLAMRLSHANVVQVFDLGRVEEQDGPSYYLAMEHVGGRDLGGLLDGWRRVGTQAPLGFALYVASEASKALDHAHRRRDDQLRSLGIVHGDLSANNVLVTWDGEVKLSDFCVARALYAVARGRLAEDERVAQKLASGSPELARGESAGPTSDVFGLGCLLYEMLAGEHPFLKTSQAETLRSVARARCRPIGELRSDLPAGLPELVHRCLALDPRHRYASSAELHEELVALRYVSGVRFGADDVVELLETRRTEVALPGETVVALLERTQRELAPPAEIRIPPAPPEEQERESSVLGPLAELKHERDVSLLVATFDAASSAPEIREHARQMLTRYGGRLIESALSDVSAVFGLNPVDSLDTENAVRAGLLVSKSLATTGASVGVDSGRVGVDDEGNLIEDERQKALVLSARRMSTLAPARVVVTAQAARNLRGRFELEPALGAAKSARMPYIVGSRRTLAGASGAFVGRKTELKELGEALKSAGRRQLTVLGLIGPHGAGKTRLVHESADRIARGSFAIACHVATCLPKGRDVPLSAIESMLRTLCGVRDTDPPEVIEAVEPRLRALGLVDDEVGAVLGALGVARKETAAGTLGAALGRMFTSLAEDRLHLFAWDDAHEFDDASGALLEGVASRLANARVLLLFSARPREEASYRAIPGYREVVLSDLDADDTRKLVAERLGAREVPAALLEFVRERAGGHPMFVEELLREAQESGAVIVREGRVDQLALDGALAVPRSLRTLIVDRVRRLPERERELLVAASVLGEPVDVAVLAAMLDLSLGQVNDLADALAKKELVTHDQPVSLGFSTSLLPEIVLGELDVDSRLELHKNAANAYPMVLGPRTEQEAARIARHLAEAGERARAAGFYATSGFYHLGSRQLERAVADFTRALALADWHGQAPDELAEWVSALGRAVRHVRAGSELPDLMQRLSLFVQSQSGIAPSVRLRIMVDLALILGAISRYKDAHRILASAAQEAEPWPDLLQASLMVEAELAARQGEFKAALATLDRVGQLGPLGANDRHRHLLAKAQALGAAGEHDQALAALDEADAVMRDGEPVLLLERVKVRGLIHGFRGDWARCASECARAAEQARELALPHEVAIHLHNQGDALMRIGDLPRAYAVLTGSATVCEQIGAERLLNLNRMMLAYLDALNDSESARRALGHCLAHAEAQKWTWDALSGRTLVGRLLARQGDTAGARRELMLARRLAEATSNQLVIDDCDRALAELKQDAS